MLRLQKGCCVPSMLRSICSTSCSMMAPSSFLWREWCGQAPWTSAVNSTWSSTTSRWQQHEERQCTHTLLPKNWSSFHHTLICIVCLFVCVCVCSSCVTIWMGRWCLLQVVPHQSSTSQSCQPCSMWLRDCSTSPHCESFTHTEIQAWLIRERK